MLSWNRPRWDTEEGISLVEMLVAMFVISVSFAALAGGLITAAHSLTDQRMRSSGTRVATTHVEDLRALGFAALSPGTTSQLETTPDGREFTVDTVIRQIDAQTGAEVVGTPTTPVVMEITATASWDVRGQTRTATYSTAVAPDVSTYNASGGVTPSPTIHTVNLTPNPVNLDGSSHPVEDIAATVVLKDFTTAPVVVTLTWTSDLAGGGTETTSQNLSSVDGGVTWTGDIPKANIRKELGGATSGNIDFTAAAGGLTALATLEVVNGTIVNPPAFTTDPTISQPIVTVENDGNCNGTNKCRNTVDLTLTASVTNLDSLADTVDAVFVKYQLDDGTFQEVALSPSGFNDGLWELVIPARTVKFKIGPAQDFTFTARRDADGAFVAKTVTRSVQKG